MVDLAPKLSGGIRPENPVVEPQGAGIALAGLGLDVLDTLGGRAAATATKPTAKDLEREALAPFANRLEELRSANIDDATFIKEARKAERQFRVSRPEYGDEAAALSASYGVETQPLEQPVTDLLTQQKTEWLSTQEGLGFAQAAIVYNDDQTINHEATALAIDAVFAERNAVLAEVRKSANSLALAKNSKEEWDIVKEREALKFTEIWTKDARTRRDGLISNAVNGAAEFDTNEEIILGLNEQITFLADSMRRDAQAIGFPPEAYNPIIEEALTPLTDLKGMIDTNLLLPGQLLTAFKQSHELGASKLLVDALGSVGIVPEYSEAFAQQFAKRMYDDDTFIDTLTKLQEIGKSETDNFSVLSDDLMRAVSDDQVVVDSVQDPDVTLPGTEKAAEKLKADPTYLKRTVNGASGILLAVDTSAKGFEKVAYDAVTNLVTVVEAETRPLGPDALKAIFNPTTTDVLAATIKGDSQESKETKRSLYHLAGKQIRRNQFILDEAVAAMEQEGIKVVRDPNNQLRLTDPNGGPPIAPQRLLSDAEKALSNINLINSRMGRVDPEWKMATKEISTTIPLDRDGNPQSIETYLTGLVERPLDQPPITPQERADMGPMLNLIDKTEGGGNYDTLFGHSQREGNPFAGVKVTDMTIGELYEFSDPNGEYGQWVKAELARLGQRARVATPMGRFQIVGRTLRRVVEKMGIPLNAKFTDEVQNAMFHFLAKEALNGKQTMTAKRKALRGVWEGFKKPVNGGPGVTDAELDEAIRAFENTPVPSYEIITGTPTSSRPINTRAERASTSSGDPIVDAFTSGSEIPVGGAQTASGGRATPSTPEAAQGAPQTVSGDTKSASQVVNERLERATRDQLVEADLNAVKQYNTEAEVQRDLEQGKLTEGELVFVEGVAMRVKGNNDG